MDFTYSIFSHWKTEDGKESKEGIPSVRIKSKFEFFQPWRVQHRVHDFGSAASVSGLSCWIYFHKKWEFFVWQRFWNFPETKFSIFWGESLNPHTNGEHQNLESFNQDLFPEEADRLYGEFQCIVNLEWEKKKMVLHTEKALQGPRKPCLLITSSADVLKCILFATTLLKFVSRIADKIQKCILEIAAAAELLC